MPDAVLIYQPLGVAVVLILIGVGGLLLRWRGQAGGLRRGAIVFCCGAFLLSAFFLFNAGFSALTWWRL